MASSSSNFLSIFNAALEAYEKTTKDKLLTHPLAAQLQSCESPAAILSVLKNIVQQSDQSSSSDQRLRNWLDPTVNVLYTFSATLGGGVGLVTLNSLSDQNLSSESDPLIVDFQVFPPANAIFTGIGVLLLVSIRPDPTLRVIVIASVRLPRMSVRVKTCSLISSRASTVSLCGSNRIRTFHRLLR